MFTATAATAAAARFQGHGLGRTEQTVVDSLREHGPKGMSVLEVGGGVGDLQVALLEIGVARSTLNVELSPTWEQAAARLLADRGLVDRVTRVLGDFVELADELIAADAVVLHRVVCCYRDWPRLLSTAAAKANLFVVLTFPRPFTKPMMGLENLYHRIRRRRFRAFVHPPTAMVELLKSGGLSPVAEHRTVLWQTVICARSDGSAVSVEDLGGDGG